MKILCINSVYKERSTGKLVESLGKVIVSSGYEFEVCYGRGIEITDANSHKVGTRLSNMVDVAFTRIFDMHAMTCVKATEQLIGIIRQEDPDIIQLHNLHGYYLNIRILFDFLKQYNRPVVWTLYDCWSFTGHCSHFDFLGCEQWKTQCKECLLKREYPASYFFSRAEKNFIEKKALFNGLQNMTIVTPSKWLARNVRDSFLGEYPIQVINDGISFETFKPVQSNIRQKLNLDDKFVVLAVTNIWTESKGFSYINTLGDMLGDDYCLIVVGDVSKVNGYKSEKIIWVEQTRSPNELAELYSTADVFVNTTLEDTFPTVNMEAQACGTSTISFDSGGSPENIDKRTGIVVERGNLDSLLSAIEEIHDNPRDCKETIEFVRNNYDRETKYLEYIKLYKDILHIR